MLCKLLKGFFILLLRLAFRTLVVIIGFLLGSIVMGAAVAALLWYNEVHITSFAILLFFAVPVGIATAIYLVKRNFGPIVEETHEFLWLWNGVRASFCLWVASLVLIGLVSSVGCGGGCETTFLLVNDPQFEAKMAAASAAEAKRWPNIFALPCGGTKDAGVFALQLLFLVSPILLAGAQRICDKQCPGTAH